MSQRRPYIVVIKKIRVEIKHYAIPGIMDEFTGNLEY